MAKSANLNPLLASQREKIGAKTFEKYAYQYHWALYRALEEHLNKNEYAIFVELHEDVVISTSLDAKKAKFEFSQVKTTAEVFNSKSLIRRSRGKSVLAKLLLSTSRKEFAGKIKEANLVSVNGFDLPLKKKELELKKFSINDLDISVVSELETAIKKELNISPLPSNLHFIIPELPDKKFQDLMIAEIAKLINTLFPRNNFNPIEVYRALYDEITRKGMVTCDIKKWDELLKSKALTSITITNLINQFTSFKDEARVSSEFDSIASELGLNLIKSKILKKDFDRYRQNKIGNRSTLQIDTSNELTSQLRSGIDAGIDQTPDLIEYVVKHSSPKIKTQFTTDNELKAAIICELIMTI